MIKSIQEYRACLQADYAANGFRGISQHFNVIRKYICALRLAELAQNAGGGLLFLAKLHLNRLSVKTGITIGLNCFEEGLIIPHYGYIVVNGTARFGKNCVLQCGVNISANATGGDHIYFGTGAKVMRDVHIADNVIIGANAVVTRNVEQENVVVAGVPAKIISNKGYRDRESV